MSDNTMFDLHVYTNNTPGGNDKVSFLCETAAAKGIRAVAFTDMCDIPLYAEQNCHRRVRHAYFDMAKAKLLFFGSVMVFAGIELCSPLFNSELAKRIICAQEYDIVLVSVNRTDKFTDFESVKDAGDNTPGSFTFEYCRELENTVADTDFDVLSKVLAPFRNTVFNPQAVRSAMQGVLKLLAEKQKALELDTRDIMGSDKLRNLYFDLLCDFNALGGKYVTFGSESRYHDDIGSGIDLARQTLKRAGFSQTAVYDKRIAYLFEL